MAVLSNGWLVIPYDGPELAQLFIDIDGKLYPAYLHYSGGKRVLQIRPPDDLQQGARLNVMVNGVLYKKDSYRG